MGSMKITDQHQYLSHDELIGLMATSGQKYQYLKFFFFFGSAHLLGFPA